MLTTVAKIWTNSQQMTEESIHSLLPTEFAQTGTKKRAEIMEIEKYTLRQRERDICICRNAAENDGIYTLST